MTNSDVAPTSTEGIPGPHPAGAAISLGAGTGGQVSDVIALLEQVARSEELALRGAHADRVAGLYEAIKWTDAVLSEASAWLLRVPQAKARKRGSAHWRTGIAVLKAGVNLVKAEDALRQAAWGSPGRAQHMQAADGFVWLATLYAGHAGAAMEEANLRLKCGNKSLPQREQLERIEAEIASAAGANESGASVAKSISPHVGRAESTIYRKVLKARRRMTASN